MKTPISILLLDNTTTFGGSTQSLCCLLRALDKAQFEPVLVTGQPGEVFEGHADCIRYQFVPKLPWVNNHIYRKFLSLRLFRFRLLRKMLNLSRFMYWLAFITIPEAVGYYRLGRRHRVALVHLNNIFGSQLAGILAAKLLRVPCVAHLRGFEEVHPITRFYARLVDHHIAISGAIRENLLNLGVPCGQIALIHNGVDLDEFRVNPDNNYLFQEFGISPQQFRYGIFSRIVDWKGIREFILAAHKISSEFPASRAFIIGGESDGDEVFLQDMHTLVADLKLENNVIFTGYREDIPALMGFMDVVVHASKLPEPFGRVIIEGMAMEKPVIATRAGGPLEIVVDGETGFLVEMGDSEALAGSVITLLRQPDKRVQMGRSGRKRVEECFSTQRNALQISEIYEKLAAACPSGAAA